ncbi:DUF6879 family protein [Streptomyces sp. Qhu_M48]|uniref:DUF6879 family protein n=1 Tax=Streptomyces sp. Qhu_M48 TaxID=3435889 RepID=UPI003F4FE1AF
MPRRLRFNGTDSMNGQCPAVHEDLDTGEVVVQGVPVTDPEDIAQLQHFGTGDAAVVVPRALLVNHGPKEIERVPRLITSQEFGKLFESFEYTAWHLETRRGYASDRADDAFRTFVETGSAPWDLDNPWSVNIRRQTDAGKSVGRVRVVDSPPTQGQLFLLDYARCNAATGEDVRNLWRADADRVRLPAEDYWIFDSRVVAVLHFDGDDNLLHIEAITEPAEVLRYVQVRDAALRHAVPYDRFAAQLTTLE